MKKVIIVALCVLTISLLFVSCSSSVEKRILTRLKSLNIREASVPSFGSDSSTPTVASTGYSEVGLQYKLLYLKADGTVTETISEAVKACLEDPNGNRTESVSLSH